MTTENLPSSESDPVIERGEVYQHNKWGNVEVTGIWQGVHQIDSARHKTETGVIIVRYSTAHDGDEVTELTDTFDEFFEAVE